MSTGGSFWHRLRMRLGGSDAMLAQLSDLIQKQIDANADVQEVTEEAILNPIIIAPSKMVLRDNLFSVVSNTVAEGLNNLLPIDPDLDLMRLWVKNDHGGRYLTDYSFMGNTVQLNGADQSKLIFSTVDDQVDNASIVNQFKDDQYIRVEDKDKSPNLNPRIKEIAATAEGISVFMRIYVQRNDNEASFGKPGVLFSKIDTEQVNYAYGAYLRSDGSIFFFVRDAAREYTLTTPAAALVYTQANLPDYTDTDYKPSDYHTVSTIDAVPDPIPYADLTFTYTFATKRMQIYKSLVNQSPVVIADSNSNPEASGLQAWYRLNEGGDIGNTPDSPASFARTVFNSVAAGNNGTITGCTWFSPNNTATETYLNFGGSNQIVDVTSYTAIQNLSTWTISLWYYPRTMPSTDGYLVRKGTLTASSWLVYHLSTGAVRFSVWNATPTRFDITSATSAIPSSALNRWYHIVAKVTINAPGKIFVNNVKVTGGGNVTGTVDTGTGNPLRLGGTTAATSPIGIVHDLKVFNRELSDTEVTTLYNAGHPIAYLPSWQANPPLVPGPPGPVTNPFVQVYNAAQPASGEQDLVRLHAITASSLTERYNVGQGAQQTPSDVTEGAAYTNDPTYDSGTAVQEAPSTYAQSGVTAVSAQYLTINNATFAGQRFLTGIDVIGKPVTKVVAKLADVNTNNTPATGNIVAKIIRNSDSSTQSTSSVVDAAGVTNNQGGSSTSAWSTHTFTFPSNAYVMVNNDRIQFEYDQGGVAPEGISSYNQLATTPIAGSYLSINYLYACGERISTGSGVIGLAISKVVAKLCDINPSAAPATGNVVAKIITAGNVTKITSDNIDASTLADNANASSTTAWTTKTFTFSGNSWPMANGDRIQFEYDQGGTAGAPGAESLSTYQQVNLSSSAGDSDVFNTQYCAEVVDDSSCPFYNKVVSKVVVACARNSSQTTLNTLHAEIIKADGTIMSSSNNIDTDGTMSLFYPQFYAQTFTFSGNTYAMQINDYIALKYNWGGASGNGSVAISANPNAEAGCHIFEVVNTTRTDTTDYDIEMDVYTQTPGPYKQVGVAANDVELETNSNVYDVPWSAPTSPTQRTGDILMDVYAANQALAKAIGIAYFTSTVANSNAYDAPWSTGTIADKSTFDLAIDPYINVATGQPNHQYTQLQLSGNKFVAEYITATNSPIYNVKLTKIQARMYKVGSPTGNIFCRIRKGAGGADITLGLNNNQSTPQLDIATLGSSSAPATLYTFENDAAGDNVTGYTLTTGDRIIFELSGGSSSGSAYAQIARTTTASTVLGTELQTSTAGSTWTSASNDDIIGIMFQGGYTPPPIFPYHTLGYGNTRITQKVTSTTVSAGNIHNRIITQVKPWFKRIGSPSGLINVVIRNAADAQVATINTYDASSVNNAAFEQITFTNLNQTYTMAINDRICIEFAGGDVNNHIQCNTNLLDTYPYGQLENYAGTSYTVQSLHDLAGSMSSGGGATDPLARTRVGEKVATTNSIIKLKKISRILVYMKRTVSPTGNVTFRIRNSADAVVATIGTLAASTIDPNTPTAYTITSSPISTYALQVGDHVSVEYNAGDDANYVEIMTSKTTDLVDGVTNTYLSKYNDVNWVPNTAIDLVGTMWEGGDSYTPSQEDVVIPDPKYSKDLTILAGGSPWTWINHDLLTSEYAHSQLFINAIMPEFRLYRKVLTLTEITNINTNRLDRATIPLGQVSKFAYSFILES